MVTFNKYKVELEFKDSEKLISTIKYLVRNEETILGELSYVFCSDEYLLSINKQFLKHDYYTDIITFDYSDSGEISGEIFISIDRVGENAKIYQATFEKELARVIIHGVLHIVGYNDKTDKQQKEMTEKENFYLNFYNTIS